MAKAAIPAKTTAVATTAQAALPAVMEGADDFAGLPTGLENLTSRDVIIPRLTILQALSPQVTRGKPEYNEENKVGDIYDVALQERFQDGIVFIPVVYQKQWLEWAPRASGKGLQGIHNTDLIMADTTKDEKGKFVLPNGNHIIETSQFYGLNVTAGFRRCFLPMASTQLKKGRTLLTWALAEEIPDSTGRMFTPPLFYRSYGLSSVTETNNEGTWMGWKVERGMALPEFPDWRNLMEKIKSFRDVITSGDVRGDIESMADEANRGGSGESPM